MAPFQRDGWKKQYLWREANRNVFSRDSRLLLVLGFALLAGIGVSLVAAFQWNAFSQLLVDSEAKGRNIVIYQGADIAVPTKIDRSSCEAISSEPGVRRAGGISLIGSAKFTQLGPAVQVFSVSSSLLPELGRVDAVVGSELGYTGVDRRFLMPDGSTQSVSQGHKEPSGIDLGNAMSVPFLPTQSSVDRCIVVLDWFSEVAESVPRLSSGLVATGGTLTSKVSFTDSVDPVETFLSRLDRFLPITLGILCGVMGLVVNRFRSSDIASYRFSGTTVRSMFLLLFYEQSLLAGCFTASSALTLLFVTNYFVDPSSQVLWTFEGGLAWLVVSTANLWLSRGDPSSLSKDR
ncbi:MULTISPECIES: hypothetical protein [Cryobacterium]|uniref:MacB-like periplasmic core domain-containing protein n=1 Tax=Cryobacterium breve TaxID=1259258 RepID=A0ABY2JE95_9MICO|nr:MULTISPECIES: hypothetical protein [Cryobacterium]TFC94496.1 hypothetical protein E3T20_08335 [Cryobacterium sp. TmT3-12]TFD01972.1 hypothetical protein E3O65_00255 [Cryobacterium breve]